jgi:hypothetical protein
VNEVIFIVLYGLSCIGGIAVASVWLKVATRGIRRLQPGKRLDTFCWVAIGLLLGALANVLIFGTRTIASLRFGVDPSITNVPEAPLIIAGLTILFVSKAVLMWAHDPTHKSLSWRWFAAICAVWVILAPVVLM